jgi:hypothetical protein
MVFRFFAWQNTPEGLLLAQEMTECWRSKRLTKLMTQTVVEHRSCSCGRQFARGSAVLHLLVLLVMMVLLLLLHHSCS